MAVLLLNFAFKVNSLFTVHNKTAKLQNSECQYLHRKNGELTYKKEIFFNTTKKTLLLFCNARCFLMFAVLLWSLFCYSLFCCSPFCFSLFCNFAVLLLGVLYPLPLRYLFYSFRMSIERDLENNHERVRTIMAGMESVERKWESKEESFDKLQVN